MALTTLSTSTHQSIDFLSFATSRSTRSRALSGGWGFQSRLPPVCGLGV